MKKAIAILVMAATMFKPVRSGGVRRVRGKKPLTPKQKKVRVRNKAARKQRKKLNK